MNHVEILPDRNSPYHLRVNGLKDNVGLQRLIRSSRFLRENHLPTEMPSRIYQLSEVWESGRMVPIGEWKKHHIQKAEERLRRAEFGYTEGRNVIDGQLVIDYLSQTDFYIVDRHLQADERIRDLTFLYNFDQFSSVIEPVFKWLRVLKQSNRTFLEDEPLPERLDVSRESIKEYFGEWMPTQMGKYLARMHKLGVVHGFPHGQNWSIVGTLYDLDSVFGEPLGDAEVTEGDVEEDIRTTIGAVRELLMNRNYLKREFPDLWKDGLAYFLAAYIGENLQDENVDDLEEKFKRLGGMGRRKKLEDEVWQKVKELLGS